MTGRRTIPPADSASLSAKRNVEGVYAQLVAKGCTCGTHSDKCPLHPPRDNRGLKAWLEAGQPGGFPIESINCAVCSLGGKRCEDELREITERLDLEGREPTPEEEASIEVFSLGMVVLRQADALMYPSPEQDEWMEEHPGEPTKHFPSTICPRCSTRAAERRLRAMVEAQGRHKLKPVTVFG